MSFFEILDKYGWPTTTLVSIAVAVWSMRERILSLFTHKQKIAEEKAKAERLQKEQEAELARTLKTKEAEIRREFEQRVFEKTLQNGQKRDEWVKWLQVRYDTTVQALHMAKQDSLDAHISTEKLTTQNVEMWQLNASILRDQSNRLTSMLERLDGTLGEVRKTLAMLQFTTVKAYKKEGGNVDDITRSIE